MVFRDGSSCFPESSLEQARARGTGECSHSDIVVERWVYPTNGCWCLFLAPGKSPYFHTLMDMRTELISGATRRPRVPFPKSTGRKPSNPGGLKKKGGPKRKIEVGDQVEVTAFRA